MSDFLIVFWALYFIFLGLTLYKVRHKLKNMTSPEQDFVKVQARYCRILALVPFLNLFVFLWASTEGLEIYHGCSLTNPER